MHRLHTRPCYIETCFLGADNFSPCLCMKIYSRSGCGLEPLKISPTRGVLYKNTRVLSSRASFVWSQNVSGVSWALKAQDPTQTYVCLPRTSSNSCYLKKGSVDRAHTPETSWLTITYQAWLVVHRVSAYKPPIRHHPTPFESLHTFGLCPRHVFTRLRGKLPRSLPDDCGVSSLRLEIIMEVRSKLAPIPPSMFVRQAEVVATIP